VSADEAPRRGLGWRRLNNAVHRDLGDLGVALTLIDAVSGVAVNHVDQWNPNDRIVRTERTFEPVPVGEREEMVATLVARRELPGPPRASFRPAAHVVHLFYDGWNVQADATAGRAVIEEPRDRLVLRDANFLHLNHPKGWWTWVADPYAVLLFLLALTGMFVLKGRQGLGGRGKWLVGLGLLAPLGFLVVLRWLA
jgi:hypothetical protein